jgi:thymidylate synthase, flavin-dependent
MSTIKVLDHGFVTLRNLSGPTRRTTLEYDADDVDPPNAARMSFDNIDEGRTKEDDLRLSKYLMKNWHTSPFEMVEVWLEMKMPIFVARQFVRHRTVSINEVSGRYVVLPAEWYVPDVVGGKAKSNKQGQEDNLSTAVQSAFKLDLHIQCSSSYTKYQRWLSEGVAPEHARMFLHLNHYTHWLWKQDLHNIMHFLSLRMGDHAQIEARTYANAVYELLNAQLPETMKLFNEYRRFK